MNVSNLPFQKPPGTSQEYELLQSQHEDSQLSQPYDRPQSGASGFYSTQAKPSSTYTGPIARRTLSHTVWSNPSTLIALPLGISGSLACFGFTYWLSKQTFYCPSWALYCEVPSQTRWIAAHLGQVQGFLSAFYSVFLSMIAYVAYRLAETTLWPAMTRRSFKFSDIDRFLEISRGLIPALPRALWHSFNGGFYYCATITIVGSLASLLFFNSIFVGHAYTLQSVGTQYYSNFTEGAGFGFKFSQSNPPGTFPVSVGDANAVYTAWANNMTAEPLPELRDFILDRRGLDNIGNATINAVKATRNMNCSAIPIRITKDVSWTSRLGDVSMMVATHIPDSGNPENDNYYELNNDHDQDGYMDVSIRIEPYMAVWVDSYQNTSATGAVTRLVFAAINGTIEGAFHEPQTDNMEILRKQWNNPPYSGIDVLTCDVHIELEDGQACIGPCTDNNSTLSSLETLTTPYGGARWISGTRYLWSLAVWLAVMPTTFGTSVWGDQPLFDNGPMLENSLSLPIAYTSTSGTASLNWTQANITNFIDVAAGAFGITITGSMPLNKTANVTVASILGTPRLQTERSWVLLIPIVVSVVAVTLLAIISMLSYRTAHVHDVRMGRVADIVVSVQTAGIRSLIDSIREGVTPLAAIDEMRMRYGTVPDGHDGLGSKGEVRSLR